MDKNSNVWKSFAYVFSAMFKSYIQTQDVFSSCIYKELKDKYLIFGDIQILFQTLFGRRCVRSNESNDEGNKRY